MLRVLKHGLFSSPRKLSLWPKKCTFLLTPWPAVTDTQTFSLKAKRQKRGRIGCSGELWKPWSYYPPPWKMCLQAPGAFNLSLLCALIHGGRWCSHASVALLSILGRPLENVEAVRFSQEATLKPSSCQCRDSLDPEERKEQRIKEFQLTTWKK